MKLADKALYMRTIDIYACCSKTHVHGVRVALVHDIHKDPNHNMQLSTFYHKYENNNREDRKVYEQMVGQATPPCKNIHLEEGVRVTAIKTNYDETAVRSIEFRLSNREIVKIGDFVDYENKLMHSLVNFADGEEVLGVYGTLGKDKSSGVRYFKQIGFILNQCED